MQNADAMKERDVKRFKHEHPLCPMEHRNRCRLEQNHSNSSNSPKEKGALEINHWTRPHGNRLKTEARKRRKPGEPVGHEQDKDAKENALTRREGTR